MNDSRSRTRPETACRASAALALLVALPLAAAAPAPPAPWSDTPQARLAALALIETLNGELLATQSATLTLERWCAAHDLARPAELHAQQLQSAVESADPEVRADLHVEPGELVIHRRVALRCGGQLLSVADNWYVPARLSQAMNEQLEHSQAPFGTVVQSLQPYRRTLAAHMLWAPLPAGWERAAPQAHSPAASGSALLLPQVLFEHRALMLGSDHRPLAELHESYQRDLLAFTEPKLP